VREGFNGVLTVGNDNFKNSMLLSVDLMFQPEKLLKRFKINKKISFQQQQKMYL